MHRGAKTTNNYLISYLKKKLNLLLIFFNCFKTVKYINKTHFYLKRFYFLAHPFF